ncbi:uncharacterized protein LOC116174733 isoform X2 [Photinus pyralis]|uniref:uncharacterized protein LOC116174733 isoform X2 n=1 Tax=Photinus pyralis TaxID=7054 RepID=UPI001267524C|nr:uncharacterized protein LOC116174733 isoform X2 [Photinus pyralis]
MVVTTSGTRWSAANTSRQYRRWTVVGEFRAAATETRLFRGRCQYRRLNHLRPMLLGLEKHQKSCNRQYNVRITGAATKVEWVVTLVVVSLISAVVGAAVMVTVLYCRRIKNTVANDDGSGVQRPPIATPDDKVISLTHSNLNSQSKGIWSCIFRNVTSTTQLDAPPASSTENHYTHMDEAYNSTDEALYAELDRYSTNSPAYQNTGYTDPDVPSSSAPSSAYYSDLSVNTVNDRTYEIVGLATTTDWEINDPQRKSAVKLSSISETVTVPSDYV